MNKSKVSLFFLYSFYLFLFLVFTSQVFSLSIDTTSSIYNFNSQVIFTICGAEQERTAVSCIDDSLLERKEWPTSCTLYVADTSDFSCTAPKIRAYAGNESITKNFTIRNYLGLIQKDIASINTSNLIDVATEVHARSIINASDEKIPVLLELLKAKRDNDDKCWPAGDCKISTSANILWSLSEAGYNTSLRIYSDGLNWIEAQQNQEENENWEVTITGEEDDTCTVKIGTSTVTNGDVTIGDEEREEVTIDYTAGTSLNVSCAMDYCVRVVDKNNIQKWSECFDIDDADEDFYNTTFTMTAGCWPRSINNSVETCNLRDTALSLRLNNIDADILSLGEEFLDDDIEEGVITGKKLGQFEDILTNLHVYNITQSADVKEWLFFSQNNDGSFGDEDDQAYVTLEVIRMFQNERNNEWIRDAEDWIKENWPEDGWDDIRANIIMHELFSTYSYRSDPAVIMSSGEDTSFRITDVPTNVSGYVLEGDVANVADVTVTAGDGFWSGALAPKEVKEGDFSGYVTFDSTDKKIPIIVRYEPYLEFNPDPLYRVFTEEGTVNISVTKSSPLVSCSFVFDAFAQNEEMVITGAVVSIPFKGLREIGLTENITGTYACSSDSADFNGSIAFSLQRINFPPFDVSISDVRGNDRPGELVIENELSFATSVGIKWKSSNPYYPLPPEVTLLPGERATVYVYQGFPSAEVSIEEFTIVLDAEGYEEEVSLTMPLAAEPLPFEDEQVVIEETGLSPFWIFFLYVLGFFAAIFALILGVKKLFSSLFGKKKKKKKAKNKKKHADAEHEKKDKKSAKEKREDHKAAKKAKKKKGKTGDAKDAATAAGEEDKKEGEDPEGDTEKKPELSIKKHRKTNDLVEVLVAIQKRAGKKNDTIIKDLSAKGYDTADIKQVLEDIDEREKELKEAEKKRKEEEAKKKAEEEKKEAKDAKPEEKKEETKAEKK